MCLTVHKNKKHKIKFGKTGYRIFWKKIEIWQDVRGVVLRGWYNTEYCYNRGWNYPTTLTIQTEINGNEIDYHGGCLHVSINKNDHNHYPVICHKNDLIANNDKEAVFKKIFIPNETYQHDVYNARFLIRKYLSQLKK